MDAQYRFLKTVCRLSGGKGWVSYAQIQKAWRACPEENVLLNLANYSYVTVDLEHGTCKFFPSPEAFSYVRTRKDSIRNLIVTTATLMLALGTLLLQINDSFF